MNYPFRTKCNRRNCGADKPTETKPPAVSSSPPPATEQVCGVSIRELLQVTAMSEYYISANVESLSEPILVLSVLTKPIWELVTAFANVNMLNLFVMVLAVLLSALDSHQYHLVTGISYIDLWC